MIFYVGSRVALGLGVSILISVAFIWGLRGPRYPW